MSFAPEYSSCMCGGIVMTAGLAEPVEVKKGGTVHRLNGPCYQEASIEDKPVGLKDIRVERHAEMNSDGTISMYTMTITNPPNSQSSKVLMDILPGVMELFLKKNRDYGDGTMDEALKLGPRAQFVDMWRKIKKLKRALWDGEKLENESAGEIVMDFIGHSFLVLLDLMPAQYRK